MHHSIPPEHAQHDLDLIAGHAAGDLSETERIRGDAVLRSCSECADLRRDLVAIAAATRTLPAAAVAPRDFRLDAGQAARLRRGGALTSLLRVFAAPRSAVRPMAMAFTSLGLAGLLVANVLPSLLGGSAALAPERDAIGAGAAAASAAPGGPGLQPVAGQPGASGDMQFGAAGSSAHPSDNGGTKRGESASFPPQVAIGGGQTPSSPAPGLDELTPQTANGESVASPAVILSLGSLVLLLLGVALFALRFAARRVR